MVCTRSRIACRGWCNILFGILTIFYTCSPSMYLVHGAPQSMSSGEELLEQLISPCPPDGSMGWSFIPRDFLPAEVIGDRLENRDNSPRSTSTAWNGPSAYEQLGTSGVAAMQMSVIDDQYVILFDKAEHNPLTTADGNHAWSALLDTHAHTVRALKLVTNSFCAGEPFLLCHRLMFLLYMCVSVDYITALKVGGGSVMAL